MKIVADTSALLAVALNEPDRERLVELSTGGELIAPEVLPFEIGNALTALMKRKLLEPNDALVIWDNIQKVPIELCKIDVRSALSIAIRFGTYAYDAYFLECSLSNRSPILTLDGRMKRIAADLSIRVLE